jgi:hypothetical protein
MFALFAAILEVLRTKQHQATTSSLAIESKCGQENNDCALQMKLRRWSTALGDRTAKTVCQCWLEIRSYRSKEHCNNITHDQTEMCPQTRSTVAEQRSAKSHEISTFVKWVKVQVIGQAQDQIAIFDWHFRRLIMFTCPWTATG